MKVLFVSSGNSGRISPIVNSQGKSLEELGISISYFLIQGKGLRGYLKNIPKLKRHLRKNNYDVVHAHYSLTAYVSSMANTKQIVVSLMGSDVKGNSSVNYILKFFCNNVWNAVIVKSNDMKKSLGYDNSHIIPNGVDINKFRPTDTIEAKNELSWDNQKIHLLFAANPDREVKNFNLFEQSVYKLRKSYKNLVIKYLRDVDMDKVPMYMNASDVVCLSSKWEGSPNVIKEAMACNRPVVSTDVGDVKWLFGDTDGHFINREQSIDEYSKELFKAISYSKVDDRTIGRQRIKDLGLTSGKVANKISKVYSSVIND